MLTGGYGHVICMSEHTLSNVEHISTVCWGCLIITIIYKCRIVDCENDLYINNKQQLYETEARSA